MDCRLERLENKVDKLLEGLTTLNVSHAHLSEEIKKISKETDENSTYRTQSKAIIAATVAVLTFVGASTALQCFDVIARPRAQTCTPPAKGEGK